MASIQENGHVEIVELIDSEESLSKSLPKTPLPTNGNGNDDNTEFQEIEKASSPPTGMQSLAYDSSDLIYTGLVILMTFLFIKFINKNLWDRYEQRNGRPAPQILMTLLNGAIIIFTMSFISVVIFEQSLFSLVAAGGIAGVGFAFALQGPILDFFSGIMMDIEGRISNGDWVRLSSGVEGRIIGHNWRSTTLSTIDNTIVVISNSRFSQDMYENITSLGSFWETIEITLDYHIPIDRAQRILLSAMIKAPGVYQQKVSANIAKFTEGGIVYNCKFMMTDYALKRKTRNDVMHAIMLALHGYQINVSETLGEYIISARKDMTPSWVYSDHQSLIMDILNKTPIIKDLGHKNLKKLNNQQNIVHFKANDTIVQQGDEGQTMYVILEGVVNVLVYDKTQKQNVDVASLGPADYFGEMALFMGDKRRATIKAVTSVIVLQIDREHIMPMIQDNQLLVEEIGQKIVAHLEQNNTFLKALQQEEEDPKPPLIKTVCRHILRVFGL